MKILAVDDQLSVLIVLRLTLTSLGVDVFTEHDPVEALKMASQQAFDMIVLDVDMPVLNGLELCRALRATGNNRDVAIFILTGNPDPDFRREAMEAGATEFMLKPFQHEDFREKVVAWKANQTIIPTKSQTKIIQTTINLSHVAASVQGNGSSRSDSMPTNDGGWAC
jgi:CheY-like chemotaxis protein